MKNKKKTAKEVSIPRQRLKYLYINIFLSLAGIILSFISLLIKN